MAVITIFGSSRPAEGTPEYRQAYEAGFSLARDGFTICNGGYGGTMEASARGAREGGGTTIGVTSEVFRRKVNRWIDKEVTTTTAVERLLKLIELGDGYLIFKGGTGTLLELAAVWEFINKGMLKEKPIVVLGDFWKPLIQTLREEMIWEGEGDCTRFIRQVSTSGECAAAFRRHLGNI